MSRKFLYGDLTQKIIISTRTIFDELGYGHPEKVYQKALQKDLLKQKIPFKRESYSKILYDGEVVGRYFLDFLIDDRVAVELKVRREIYENDWIQLLNYLKAKELKVGLLIVFMKSGVAVKRLMN